MTTAQILVVDDEQNLRILIEALLESAGYRVLLASGGEEALAHAAAGEPDLAIVDLRMPGMDGLTLLEHLLRLHPVLPVLMLTAHGTVAQAVEAMQRGAYDFLTKPFDGTDLLTRIAKALEVQRLKREVARLQTLVQDRAHFEHIVTCNAKMQQVLHRVKQIASTDTTVCLYGESGTGKELIAKALHLASHRAEAPFVAINCGAIPEGLLENELFGHEKGAFTGAERAKRGLLLQAHSGTLFLDEVGELPALLQVKLLRVLQEREFYAVGAEQPTKVDLRLIAATNRDLGQAVAAGTFRTDLYYRLHVIPIVLPPLRERRDDIPLLAQYFLERYSQALDKEIQGFTPAALQRLLAYAWPGNVRELANVVERAVVLTTRPLMTPDLLLLEETLDHPEMMLAPVPPVADSQVKEDASPRLVLETLEQARAACERAYLVQVLTATHGIVARAAVLAGMHRGPFYKLLQKYAIEPEAFRHATGSFPSHVRR
jgi:two-component system response regulator GlrR